MKIGLVHFRVGENDGVSLEMDKWKKVLERMGHEVVYVAGDLNGLPGIHIPSISMRNDTNFLIHSLAFEKLSVDERSFVKIFEEYVSKIYKELDDNLPELDLIIVHNILSLGFNLAAAVAITNYVREHKIKLLVHHHDFYWERERYSRPQCQYVRKILDDYFPPKGEGIFHITINTLARNELIRRKNISSTVVPNVFDFDQPGWVIDDYNKDLKTTLGINENDLVILHATRIVERKAIEIAMDFVEEFSRLENRPIHFVLAGFPEKESMVYYEKLIKKSQKLSYKVHFANEIIKNSRYISSDGKKYYSLWDTYAISDAVTYTSVLEGWGNQLIEAVFARKPLIIFEYPVYKSDIAPLGFEFISLSDKAIYDNKDGFFKVERPVLTKAAISLKELISDPNLLESQVKRNFEIGKKYLSLDSLKGYVGSILRNIQS
jgi:hypothetical protein